MKIDKCMFAFFEMFLQISLEDAANYSCEQSSLKEHHLYKTVSSSIRM